MYQKIDLQQLQNHSLDELKAIKNKAVARKAELEAAKTKGGKGWTPDMQEEFDEVALFLVDLEEIIDQKMLEEPATPSYIPEPGTENMVHLSIVRGRRFNPMTGAEISKPFIQKFTFAEWQLFKNNFKGLGYTIMEALHDPYGDAKALVYKEESR